MKNYFKVLTIFLITLSSILSSPTIANGQYVNIPDSSFRVWLNINGYSSCMLGTLMDTNCFAIKNDTLIDIWGVPIQDLTGIEYFTNLRYLSVQLGLVNFLPPLPPLLKLLRVTNNQLSSLPAIPPGLIELICKNNQLTSLPPLPASLRVLDFSGNPTLPFPTLHNNIRELSCSMNSLTSLPQLPDSLVNLTCNYNLLSSLPTLPSKLVYLNCGYNQITTLPALPTNLDLLDCGANQLSSLPALPASLKSLYLGGNSITSLPTLPTGLIELVSSNNLLTTVPKLPSTIIYLILNHNNLTSLPELPDSLSFLDISYNPNLYCLPPLKKIIIFQFTGTAITCLPNYGQITYPTPLLAGMPLCQPSNNCLPYSNITGQIFNDANANCIYDIGEDKLHYIPVRLDSSGVIKQYSHTNTEGEFAFQVGFGNYTVKVDTTSLPYNVTCPSSFSYTVTLNTANPVDSNAYFGLQCKPGFDLEAKSIMPLQQFRPGAQRIVYLKTGNNFQFNGSQCPISTPGTVQALLSGPVSFISAAPGALTPSSVVGSIITWNVNDFSLSNPDTDYNIIVGVSTSATINDMVCIQLIISPSSGDYNPANNVLNECFPVVNSFDPNEKYMSPSGYVDLNQEWFTFTIFFQNTGNAPAEDIYLLDTLSNKLEPSSFKFLNSSHPTILQMLPGSVLRFNFPNINLADSVNNEPESHGFVQFKVKRIPGLFAGAVIENKAFIFFDFNPAVITNTTSATLTITTGSYDLNKKDLHIYPNPTSDVLRIKGNILIKNIHLYDVLGREVFVEFEIGNDEVLIDMAGLREGLYILQVDGAGVVKVIKK